MVKRAFGLGKKHVFRNFFSASLSPRDGALILGAWLVIVVVIGGLFLYKVSVYDKALADTQKSAVAAQTNVAATDEKTAASVEQPMSTPAQEQPAPVAQQPAASTDSTTPATQSTTAADVEYQAWLDKVCPGTQQWIDSMNQRGEGYAVTLLKSNQAGSWKMLYDKCIAAGRLTPLY